MNELTVIIPFLNEGREIYETLADIRRTAGNRVEVLLVDDCSDDRHDYEGWARIFGVSYIRNDRRRGVAESRNEYPHVPKLAKFKPPRCPNGMFWNTLCFM